MHAQQAFSYWAGRARVKHACMREGRTMKSPFPGMDPYIEASGLWEDFHNHFVESIAAALADVVPPHYFIKSGERAYSETYRETFIEIYAESTERELVTCREVLSSS